MTYQIEVKPITLRSIMNSYHFMLGYNEVMNNQPFNAAYDRWTTPEQWNYERGRQFTVATEKVVKPKSGKTVNHYAIWQLHILIQEGAMR